MYNGINYGSLVLIFTEPNFKINVVTMDTNLFTPMNQVILTASTFKELITKKFSRTYQSTESYLNQTNEVQNVVEKYFRPSGNKTPLVLFFTNPKIVLRIIW
jgi:hypothetical protein